MVYYLHRLAAYKRPFVYKNYAYLVARPSLHRISPKRIMPYRFCQIHDSFKYHFVYPEKDNGSFLNENNILSRKILYRIDINLDILVTTPIFHRINFEGQSLTNVIKLIFKFN